jgi:hypothetical protein
MNTVDVVAIGQIVTVRCPPCQGDPTETWLRGIVRRTLARNEESGHAVHVIEVQQFKWAAADAWGYYDGVPEVLAREIPQKFELEWLDTWPRRSAGRLV